MSLSRAFSLFLALAACASLQPAAAVTEADIAFCIVDGFYWNRFEIQYFFFDTTYGRWSNQDKQLQSSYPKPISTGWPGIPTRFDAVLDYENRVYFFKDGQYWRWNLGGVDQVDPPYPRPISPTWWPGVPDNLDAAFKWQNKYYFIADSQYHVFDKNQNKVVESGDIQTKWPGLPSDIDTAFVYNDLWLYFFKGLKYWRYDLSGPAAGYPKNICTGWGICDHVLCAVKVAPVAPAFAASTASASAAEFVTASEVEADSSTATAANDSNLRGFTASANTAEAAPGPDTSGDTGSGSEGSSGGDGALVSASNVDQGDSP